MSRLWFKFNGNVADLILQRAEWRTATMTTMAKRTKKGLWENDNEMQIFVDVTIGLHTNRNTSSRFLFVELCRRNGSESLKLGLYRFSHDSPVVACITPEMRESKEKSGQLKCNNKTFWFALAKKYNIQSRSAAISFKGYSLYVEMKMKINDFSSSYEKLTQW